MNKKGEKGDEIIFITEILGAGSLKQFIKKVKVIRWKVVKRWVRDILKGLVYLHSRGPSVIHRDLKCDNVFINGQKGDLRIGDLGLSRRKDMAEKGKMALTLAGTPAFMAPEFYTEQYVRAFLVRSARGVFSVVHSGGFSTICACSRVDVFFLYSRVVSLFFFLRVGSFALLLLLLLWLFFFLHKVR